MTFSTRHRTINSRCVSKRWSRRGAYQSLARRRISHAGPARDRPITPRCPGAKIGATEGGLSTRAPRRAVNSRGKARPPVILIISPDPRAGLSSSFVNSPACLLGRARPYRYSRRSLTGVCFCSSSFFFRSFGLLGGKGWTLGDIFVLIVVVGSYYIYGYKE